MFSVIFSFSPDAAMSLLISSNLRFLRLEPSDLMGVDSSVEPPGLVVTRVAGREGSWTVYCEVLEATPLN